jgi:hypothetical protein
MNKNINNNRRESIMHYIVKDNESSYVNNRCDSNRLIVS